MKNDGAKTPRAQQARATSPSDIRRRCLAFAVRTPRLVRAPPRDVCGMFVGRQLARSGTSVGANVEEAQAAPSKADFARRGTIALTEARESLCGLRLLAETGMLPARRLTSIIEEAEEISRVLGAIVCASRRPRAS